MPAVTHLGFFPFCIWPSKEAFIEYAELGTGGRLSYEQLQNVIASIESDLQTIMALYWRVKKWKVTGDFLYSKETSGDPPEPVIETVPYEFFFERDKNPESAQNNTTEKDLVCLVNPDPDDPEYPQRFWDIIQFRRTGDPIEIVTESGTATWGANFAAPVIRTFTSDVRPIIKQEDNLYSCGLFFIFSGPEEGPEPDDTYSAGGIFRAENEEFSNTTVPITFLGQTFDVFATDNNSDEENPSPLITTMAIEAVEYWPYDPLDGGGPTYDSTTGQRLR